MQVFAQGGRGRVTSRVYSLAVDEQWDVRAFGSFGSGSIEITGAIWGMDSCWKDSIELESHR